MEQYDERNWRWLNLIGLVAVLGLIALRELPADNQEMLLIIWVFMTFGAMLLWVKADGFAANRVEPRPRIKSLSVEQWLEEHRLLDEETKVMK